MKPYYDEDGITIYHGDCREVLPTLPVADLLLTDPPYGISYRHGFRKGGVAYGNDGVTIMGDEEPFDPTHLVGAAPRLILWGANHYADALPRSRGWLVWDKRDGDGPTDQSDVELAWTNFLNIARCYSARWRGAMRQGREQREGRIHVNQKPVALMAWCIQISGGARTVCDPYMGSGSTLVAAREAGLRAIGLEIEERYCEIAVKRLSQQTLGLEGGA